MTGPCAYGAGWRVYAGEGGDVYVEGAGSERCERTSKG
jgi:hypothetical protein